MTCAFAVTDGILMTRHLGARLERPEDIPDKRFVIERRRIGGQSTVQMFDEFPGWNSELRGSEPALKVTFADGTRDLRLVYSSHSIDGDTLTIYLTDPL